MKQREFKNVIVVFRRLMSQGIRVSVWVESRGLFCVESESNLKAAQQGPVLYKVQVFLDDQMSILSQKMLFPP
jgi:hypothetical protein